MKGASRIYFLGIGGIGMSAIARYYHSNGVDVAGYDKTSTALTSELVKEGIRISFNDAVSDLPDEFLDANNTMVVYTPAIPADHPQYIYFLQNKFRMLKRAAVLGELTSHCNTISVAGTHGKTTTSSLIAHILKHSGKEPSAFLGGITRNYETNLLIGKPGPSGELMVVEADEYDRSFLTLNPQVAVITSMDADHLDIYGDSAHVEESFRMFAALVKQLLVVKHAIRSQIPDGCPKLSYSLSDAAADSFCTDITVKDGTYRFSVRTRKQTYSDLELGLPGKHNVENAVAAITVAEYFGVEETELRESLRTFRGVKRRFDYHVKSRDHIYIDDYAHHPEELRATISSVREMYPGTRITGVFQPHLFSRTRDFADDFAASLDLLDECILLPVYPAREKPIAGVSSEMLIDRMKKAERMICQKDDLIETIRQKKPRLLLTMGAGDIDMFIKPITELLKA
jgi:UDP-N-acetylmuramate--alanine ligase